MTGIKCPVLLVVVTCLWLSGRGGPISTVDSETTIQCTSTNSPLTGLVWRFNHSQTILTQTGPDGLVNVSEGWEHHVKSVSESGSLTLQKLSSNHEGVYTCELSGAEQTTVTSTFLRIDTDTDLSCVFMERCILPCSFQASKDLVIHWYHTDNDYPVHSYYNSQDQLGHQNQRFRGRTSLFKDEISRGNASLQLTGVEVQDEGRYKCYTSTTYGKKYSYINLNVDALVRKVDIEQVGNRIHCSSEGIYPEPELTWSTRPPSTVTFENTTTVQQTEQRLYSISSSLIVSDSVTGLDYICTVSTHTNRRTATVFKRSPISTADSETTIQCTSTNSPLTGLVWRFNHSQTILTQTGPDALVNVSEGWEHHVKSVSKSGSLTLQKLSSNHEGVYTCELSGAEQTTVTSTFLRIDTETSHNRGAIVGGVIGFVVLGVVCLLC